MPHHRLAAASLAVLIVLAGSLVATPALGAWDDCEPIDHSGEWEYRHERAESARTEAQLRALFENPTVIEAAAVPTDERGASIDTLTQTHAVFPVDTASMMRTLRSNDILTSFMPNLGDHEVVCRLSDHVERQRQRTDFGRLIFKLGTEYVIDVEYVDVGPDVHSSRWALVESLDGRMSYLYGSWYFESITLDGTPATYVRHYARTGLTTRVPGVRAFIDRRLEGQVTNLFTVFYQEAARRFGRTVLE
ncbi:MAG: hypothetical protein ACOC2D_09190 [Spirochaetota bacterium]